MSRSWWITLHGSPEIVKNFGVRGTCAPIIRRPRIPLFKGGESVIRLSLGRRLVKLLPVAQRTKAFTNKWRRRQTMGRWSWVRISRPPWRKKTLFQEKKWITSCQESDKSLSPGPQGCKKLPSRHVRPHTKTKNPAVQRGEECYKA